LDSYVSTHALKVSEQGVKLSKILDLGNKLRLDRRDELLVQDNLIYLVSGKRVEKKIELSLIQLNSDF